jgi:hypothetical protein
VFDEGDLIARCIRRSLGAWEELLARYRDGIRRAASITLQRGVGSATDDDV